MHNIDLILHWKPHFNNRKNIVLLILIWAWFKIKCEVTLTYAITKISFFIIKEITK